MKFFWNISCLCVCLFVLCLHLDRVEANQDGKMEKPQVVEKSLSAWIDLLRQEMLKENRHDDDLQDEPRRGPLLPCIYNGLNDLHGRIVMRTRSLPDSSFDYYQPSSHHQSEHSMFYTPRLGRSFAEKQK